MDHCIEEILSECGMRGAMNTQWVCSHPRKVALSGTSSAPINVHHFIVTHGYTHGVASMLDQEYG